ncbi:hypothetical protein ATANTOWER_007147 [Ataeniobius toweri]|uniref:Uncharacterized protein n=1 Tax=Ataeniobius toweri TaxID=208326 RepID=A0ABU7AAT7_9TELE|nr:hypothetical protein [Ataeniobius toweri]
MTVVPPEPILEPQDLRNWKKSANYHIRPQTMSRKRPLLKVDAPVGLVRTTAGTMWRTDPPLLCGICSRSERLGRDGGSSVCVEDRSRFVGAQHSKINTKNI